MTFQEWFEQEFWPIDEDERFVQQMRRAWDEGYDQGIADSDPAVYYEDAPELAGDGSNHE